MMVQQQWQAFKTIIERTNPQDLFVHFVHCYADILNLVLTQSVTEILECKIFFSTLSSIAGFSSRSPKHTEF